MRTQIWKDYQYVNSGSLRGRIMSDSIFFFIALEFSKFSARHIYYFAQCLARNSIHASY